MAQTLKTVGDVYKGGEGKLSRQAPSNPVRIKLEKELRQSVRKSIESARTNSTSLITKQTVTLLRDSLNTPANSW